MVNKVLLFVLFSFIPISSALCQLDKPNPDVNAVMRLIGHEILKQSGDSSSQILPIEKVVDRYKISFADTFSFQPEDLVQTINQIVKKTNISKSYSIEIERCENNEIVYAYKMGHENQTDIIPCRGRKQPAGCYSVFFTILDSDYLNSKQSFGTTTLILFALLTILFTFILFRRQRKRAKEISSTISIGQFQFDKINLALYLRKNIIELSGKESDLLYLLYSNVNKTVTREIILKEVWGDEGDYIGRTLDVFISKLRKKLADDPQVKIINIRGVGYKFIVND
ncbi:MAG: winged helix-turn-helix domain-containing protein [Crocinitomicaceae bacterium]